jgi:hypothetical protein
MITRQASTTSFASAGRSVIRPGMARKDARCSTGWRVGPSSPTPMESWVKVWITGISISALKRIAALLARLDAAGARP